MQAFSNYNYIHQKMFEELHHAKLSEDIDENFVHIYMHVYFSYDYVYKNATTGTSILR